MFIDQLDAIIADRLASKPTGSYIAKLSEGGLDRVLKKVAEEAGEVIIAAKNGVATDTIHEAADLLFHLLITLSMSGITFDEVLAELERRHQAKPIRT